MDKYEGVKSLREGVQGCLLPFETVAKRFHLIEQNTCTVYIPIGDGDKLCKRLLERNAGREDYRRAGQYSVNIYEQHFRDLLSAGDIQPLTGNSAVLLNLNLYDPEKGLSMKSDPGKAEFI